MHNALRDKTNKANSEIMEKNSVISEKESIILYVKNKAANTKDYDLKYDLLKCVELLEGKENQEYIDLKETLEEILCEKEKLFMEKCELAVELDYLKSKEKKYKRRAE